MSSDAEFDPALERAYPYCSGLQVIGCAAFFFAMLGAAGAAMLPFGCEQLRAGKMPLGIALLVIGLFTAPMLLFSLLMVYSGIRDAVRPPLLRVTPTALVLPLALRDFPPEQQEQDERGEPKKPDPPGAHPEELPFAAIRWVRRESKVNPGSDRLMIVHDLAPVTLVIEQYMMRRGDFDELETVLRTALPAAFASAPPKPE
jgi:hypothetical protein